MRAAQEIKTDPESGAPITCETCLYLATHERCDAAKDGSRKDCLHPDGDYSSPQMFANWQGAHFGQSLARVHALEVLGQRSIVIGGSGEAEVCQGTPPAEVSEHLHYVAEQCGYYCGNLSKNDKGKQSLCVGIDGRSFRIEWICGSLWRIVQTLYDRETGEPTGEEKEVWSCLGLIRHDSKKGS